LRQLDGCVIADIPRDNQRARTGPGVRFAPQSRTVTAALRDCGFAHEGEQIEAVVDGICIANLPEDTVSALKMSIRMP
jgi:hypothetical protein